MHRSLSEINDAFEMSWQLLVTGSQLVLTGLGKLKMSQPSWAVRALAQGFRQSFARIG